MDLNQMQIFGKVAENQSFTKAAQELGIEKSTVSMKVTQLEERLGARLLNRTTRSVTLTEAGEGYYRYCQQIIDTAKEAEHFAETFTAEPQGLLRISASIDFGQIVVNELIDPLLMKYPKLEIDLNLSNAYVDLVRERIDIALRPTRGTLRDSSLIAKQILQTSLGLYASPAYIKKRGMPETLQQVYEHDFISFSLGDASPLHVTKDGAQYDFTPKARLHINDVLSCKRAAVSGLGITLLPCRIARQEVKDKQLIPLLADYVFPTITLFAVYTSRQWLPSKVKVFLDYLEGWQ
jgi:DNA-binding transcriptional LysR family regulator